MRETIAVLAHRSELSVILSPLSAFEGENQCGKARFIRSHLLRFKMISNDSFHFVLGAHDDWAALMEIRRLSFHDPLGAGGHQAAGLFDDEAHRVGFIHQTQFAVLVFGT